MTPAATPPRRGRGDGGALLVEAALVTPLVLFVIMGMFDFAFFELRQSQLSSAARDGARTAIITAPNSTNPNYLNADSSANSAYVGGSCTAGGFTPGFTRICTAVNKRLAGAKVTAITATCFDGPGNSQPCKPYDPLTDTGITDGLGSIKVTVSYVYSSMTPVGQKLIARKIYTSSAEMVVS
jgi:Flp pilus assembly protein TadG